ncbi:MAG: outer membrane protein assembly factor BamE [Dongiaceae bacterium]
MNLSPPRRPRPAAAVIGAAALAASIVLAGCQPRIDARGNLPDPDTVGQIQPGVQSRAQVADLLGSPSVASTFDDKTWYYISGRTETYAFFEPKVVDQQVLVVEFDDAGMVSGIERYDYEDGRVIDPVSRETPTSGQELTFLQQLFGNLGRFNKQDK